MIPGDPVYDWGQGFSRYSPPPKMPSPYLHPSAIIAPCANAFKMQPELHNSADRGIFKFVYLRLHLVVCFYPRPPVWPWSWGYTCLRLRWVVSINRNRHIIHLGNPDTRQRHSPISSRHYNLTKRNHYYKKHNEILVDLLQCITILTLSTKLHWLYSFWNFDSISVLPIFANFATSPSHLIKSLFLS